MDAEEDILSPETSKSKRTTLPARYVFALLGSFGFFNFYAMRVNLSVAIIAMAKSPNNSNVSMTRSDIPCKELFKDFKEDNNSSRKPAETEFQWNSNIQGAVLGAFFYGYIITQVPGGILAEKYGAKWLFWGGMFMTTIFTLLTPVAARWNVWALFVARFIKGLGEGVVYPAMNSLIGQWAPKLERSRIAVFIYTGGNIGNVGTLAISGVLSDKLGWPSVFYFFGALGCVLITLWAILVFESPEVHPRISNDELIFIREGRENKERPPVPWKSVLTSIPLWALVVTHFGMAWGFYMFLIEIPMYLSNILHFDLEKNGLISSLPILSLSVCAMISSVFADKLRKSGKLRITTIRKIFNTIGLIVPALCLLVVAFSGCRPTLIIIIFIFAMGINGCVYSGLNVTHVDMSPDFAGILFGITNFFANFTGFLVPAYVGWIMQNGQTVKNWSIVFITTSALMTISALVYDVFCSSELQPWGVSESRPQARHSETEDLTNEDVPHTYSKALLNQ